VARHVVALVGEIPEGGRKLVTIRGREIGVFNRGGAYFALLNRCPHQGGDLCKGTLIGLVTSREPGEFTYSRPGEMLKCPWHGWEFDLRTGQSYCDPDDIKARAFQVELVAGEQVARGPFVAETFPVENEKDYLIIEL
jgi:3-phenylpropionate/trans-cinnamate dioxygenase ferredoxin subunit